MRCYANMLIYGISMIWEITGSIRWNCLKSPKEHENIMPTCLKVTGKTPPEDCGSVGGYQELLQQIADGNEEMIKWEEHSAEKIKI